MKLDKIINGNCWIAYIDILGFKKKILSFEKGFGCGRLDLFKQNFYGELVDELRRRDKYWPDKVFTSWFSDTFLFFTHDDSRDTFVYIAGLVKQFCWWLFSKNWPLRAAIGFGQLYADKSNNIFLGSGLIDAYEYAEKQDWIGIVVTPNADKRLRELGTRLKRRPVMFREYDVPVKQKEIKDGKGVFVEKTERLFAVRIHQGPNIRRIIEQMQRGIMIRDPQDYEDRYRAKYENTLKFFNG
jgi:hypothetical protein